MMDIALVWNPANGRADFAMSGGDLLMDSTIQTAVIISLFCDRLADPSDVLPGGAQDSDRRGFWGDDDPRNLTGSKFYQRLRSLQVPATARQLESDARQALAWMQTAGLITAIQATAALPQLYWVTLTIVLTLPDASNVTLTFPVKAAPTVFTLPPPLTDNAGNEMFDNAGTPLFSSAT